ncbi:MAG: pre-16S rRNA-processing nuclease YqgF [Synechococcales cyanobacterium K44_A2020_017]|jgi:RNase H-fold protein (predicted Holliday junction resolvase)|uniref:pre-16S rRNA-processing nuclease YqgF n=1 Tax=Leptolyngbya sp. CCY15150 TaxID=2767772 RepID=UPI00194FC030|nr:pre-16S rRNA-processing nuclease YqgF [Leptolyngbya sp. CCY15150]MBF2089752.1 pre-16S rRNA-processing nuclease YqgF [Synechococcales cyanobacterium K32_A2020_035]MBF2095091.1 pre-16S rRNA-processing nuclease YqgF [Synechococcales cyanobacterium K44_A2020_017]
MGSAPLTPPPQQPVILGFDPGRQKCGVAVMALDRRLLFQQVVSAEQAIATIDTLQQQFPISLMVMGNQTSAKQWKQKVVDELPTSLRVVMVDERYSTLQARDRYWDMYPPKGIRRLLPQKLRSIPRPIDDIVAILLIERYFDHLTDPPS